MDMPGGKTRASQELGIREFLELEFGQKTATICGKSIKFPLITNRCLPLANTPGYESSPGTKIRNL